MPGFDLVAGNRRIRLKINGAGSAVWARIRRAPVPDRRAVRWRYALLPDSCRLTEFRPSTNLPGSRIRHVALPAVYGKRVAIVSWRSASSTSIPTAAKRCSCQFPCLFQLSGHAQSSFGSSFAENCATWRAISLSGLDRLSGRS